MTAAKLKAKRARRPIYLQVCRLMDPSTGEMVGALVPSHPVDRRLMRDRKFEVGREIRAELKQGRNAAFHRLVHAVGTLLVDHAEGFESLTSHDAIKRVQREAGVMCESMEIDLGTLGKVAVNLPRSISYDEMEEAEFREFFEGIRRHVEARYIPALGEHARAEYWLMTNGGEQ